MKRPIERKYKVLGIYFLILQLFVFLRNHLLGEQILFFYYCDNIALFLAIGFLTRNIQLIKGLISSGLILQVVYLLDLLSIIFFDQELTGTTIYLFDYNTFLLIITLFMHFGTAFVALLFTVQEETRWTALLYALAYLAFLYFTTIAFTPKELDMNCIFNACDVSWAYFEGFTRWWIVTAFLCLVIPTHLLQMGLQRLVAKVKAIRADDTE